MEREKYPLAQGDAYADKIIVHVLEHGENVDLSGVGVSAKVIRYDGQTVPLVGTAEDGMACVVLDAECYAVPGDVQVSVTLTAGDVVQTILMLTLNVETSETDVVVDNDVIGDLSSLLGVVAEMKAATAEAKAAIDDMQQQVEDFFGTTDGAPAIVCESDQAVATATDAAAKNALHVVSVIEADVSGTPDYTAGTIATIAPRDAVTLYHGATYDEGTATVRSASLPEPVYGGTLDWVTGVLTVTHAVRNLTAANWTASSIATNRYLLAMKTASLDACTHYPISAWIAYDNVIIRNSPNQVVVNCSSIATLADWKAYLSAQEAAGTPVTVVYGLPEDQRYTVQLDPQTITMLKGSNALWSDTGNTAVKYVADTKMYVDAHQGTGGGGGVQFVTDETLTMANGILSVNTADTVEADNTLPVTSAAVNVTVGNINALLATI